MEIDWRGKHNQWFKNWLEDNEFPQYWNTMCCNYWDDNWYFENAAYDTTVEKCKQLVGNFERNAKCWIEHIEMLGLDPDKEISTKKNIDRKEINKRK